MSLGGTKRTSSDVCNSVAIGGKAEVGFRACQGQLLAQSGRSQACASGDERKWDFRSLKSVDDPARFSRSLYPNKDERPADNPRAFSTYLVALERLCKLLSAAADLLDRLLHRVGLPAGFLRGVTYFVVLTSRDPSAVRSATHLFSLAFLAISCSSERSGYIEGARPLGRLRAGHGPIAWLRRRGPRHPREPDLTRHSRPREQRYAKRTRVPIPHVSSRTYRATRVAWLRSGCGGTRP